VRYIQERTFDDYVESAFDQLPQSCSISLVAESFSGPIAISMLAKKQREFGASVLSATFCKSPLPLLSQFSKHLPEIAFTTNPVSKVVLDLLVTGSDASREVKNKAKELLERVQPNKFQERINVVNELDVTYQIKDIDVPLLYIQASKDKIVFKESGIEIMKHAKNLVIEKVEGSHMILQTQPERCAELIVRHVTSNKRMQSDAAEPRR